MIFTVPLIVLIVVFSILPFAASAFSVESFSALEMITIARDSSMRLSLIVSLLYALISVGASIGIGMRFAYRIFLMKKRNQNLILFLLFITWMIPGFICIPIYRSILYWFTDSLIDNSLMALIYNIIIKVWMSLPIVTLISFASINNTQKNQIEQMSLEGAGREQLYEFLLKPLTKSTLFGFSLILLLNGMRDLSVPLMLTNGRPILQSGFTAYGIAGSTTTAGLFLKNSLYTLNGDFIAYSQSLFITLFILILFLTINKLREGHHAFLIIAPIFDLFFYFDLFSLLGLVVFCLLLFYKKGKPFLLFLPPVIVSLLYGELSIGLMTYMIMLLFIAKKGNLTLWKKLINRFSDLAIVMWLALTLLIFFNFVKLIGSNPLYVPDWNEFNAFNLNNFSELLSDGFALNLLNSSIIGLSAALLTVLIVLPAAFSCVVKKKAHEKLSALLILSMVLTGMNTLVPLFFIFRLTGLIDNLFGVILIVVNHAIPMAFLISYEDMKNIPLSFIDNARIEGASFFKTFTKVVFPQILPIILIIFAKVMIDGWSSFIAPLIFITDASKYPVSLRLFSYAGKDSLMYPQWGKFAAGSFLSLLIMFLIIFPFRRVLFKGVYRSWANEQI